MVRPTTFEITEQKKGETRVLSVIGELDLGTVPTLARRVAAKLDEKPPILKLDLSDLTFMDSSGLRLLIELHDRSRRETWKLVLVRSKHERANAVFRLTGADSALPFEPSPG